MKLDLETLKKFCLSEGMRYLVVGCMTTAVNFIVYTVILQLGMRSGLSEQAAYKPAYVVAFVAAVLFAYWTNKRWVFQSGEYRLRYLLRELAGFFGARIFSGAVCMGLMYLMVDVLSLNAYLAWLLSTVFNLVFNYVASKFWIFKENKDGEA